MIKGHLEVNFLYRGMFLKAKMFTAHVPCHVTCRQRIKYNHIIGIFVAVLSIHYTTFMGL